MVTEFRVPELGENIASGTVAKVLVAVGDTVAVDQPVLELETDKAVLEIPSTVAGTVSEIRVQVGKSVNIGDVVLVVSAAGNGGDASAAKPAPPKTAAARPAAPVAPAPKPQAPLRSSAPPPPAAKAAPKPPTATPAVPAAASGASARAILAAPSVRRMARELGIDLAQVTGSGPGGRISADDVRALSTPVANGTTPAETIAAPGSTESDQDRWGPIERQPMSAIRRKTAVHMTSAWETIPHVTHFDHADVTQLESFRKQHGREVEAAGGKLTATVILMKALAAALKKFPQFNASVDMEHEAVILRKYINIGVAVDTPNGLLVPVVRNADLKTLTELAVEITQLAEKARARKLTLDDMQGGTFTLTNLGGIGGTNFAPIINLPEVAILGVSRSRVEPVFSNGAFVPRTMLPLALSYDHRIIDGADAARFLRWLAEALEQPWVLFLEQNR